MRSYGMEFSPNTDSGQLPDPFEEPNFKQHRYTVDLGPIDPTEMSDPQGLGPDTPSQEAAFRDVDELDYIDQREPTGIHCMDDRVLEPGIQLPGGLIETGIVSRLMNPRIEPVPVSQAYKIVTEELLGWGMPSWVHNDCAAGIYKRTALEKIALHEGDAVEFTEVILDELGLTYRNFHKTDAAIDEAIFAGAANAMNPALWDITYEKGLQIATEAGAPYEHFDYEHTPAGLRIDTTSNLFDNAQFRADHDISGKQMGALSVTMGAYRDMLANQGMKERAIMKSVIRASLFTYGLAKTIGDEYLRAVVVAPRR